MFTGYVMCFHSIKPILDNNSKILILGTFPSVKSRELHFFYAHPQNRFWPLMANLLGCSTPLSTNEIKEALLIRNNIALWDIVASCEVEGSSDTKIKNIKYNNIKDILSVSQINAIFTNGKKAYDLLIKSNQNCGLPITTLPSTSPANAQFSFETLKKKWAVILDKI